MTVRGLNKKIQFQCAVDICFSFSQNSQSLFIYFTLNMGNEQARFIYYSLGKIIESKHDILSQENVFPL